MKSIQIYLQEFKKIIVSRNGKFFLALLLLIISVITVITILLNQTKSTKKQQDKKLDNVPMSYAQVSYIPTPQEEPAPEIELSPEETAALELSKKFYADTNFVSIDTCNKKFTNPNFDKITFVFDSCIWTVEQSLDPERIQYGYFGVNIDLINKNYPNVKAQLDIFSPWPMGWSGPTPCYEKMDIYKVSNSNIFRKKYQHRKEDKEIYLYSTRFIVPTDSRFNQITENRDFIDFIPSYPTNGPISYSINDISYCSSAGPDFSSTASVLNKNRPLIKKDYNITDPNYANYFLIMSLITESMDEEFVKSLDKIAETLTF